MARVLVGTQPWGVLWEKAGSRVLSVPVAGQLAAITTTVYTALTGGTTIAPAAFITNADGQLPGYVEPGAYTLTIGGVTQAVEAVSAASVLALESGRLQKAPTTNADNTITKAFNSTGNPFTIHVDTGLGVAHDRFIVENNQDIDGGHIDINFRSAAISVGTNNASNSLAGTAITFLSPLADSSVAWSVKKPGETQTGVTALYASRNGALISNAWGLASRMYGIYAAAEAQARFEIVEDGSDVAIRWGPGGAVAPDTRLRRFGAGVAQIGQVGASGALELTFISTEATLQAYDRTASVFRPMNITGSNINLAPGNTTKFKADTTGLGFFGTAPIAKPSVTGARGGNAALASALTQLAALGLITDSSTA